MKVKGMQTKKSSESEAKGTSTRNLEALKRKHIQTNESSEQ